jgi:hypothetical protein
MKTLADIGRASEGNRSTSLHFPLIILRMETDRKFVLAVDLDGVCADFYTGLRPIAAEWLGDVDDPAARGKHRKLRSDTCAPSS